MTVTDEQGKTGTDTVEVVVTADGNQPPVVTGDRRPRARASRRSTVAFSAQAIDPDGDARDIIYLWDFGDGGANAFGRDVEHTYRTPGTYTATVTATDSGGAFDTDEVAVDGRRPAGQPAADGDGRGRAAVRHRAAAGELHARSPATRTAISSTTVWDFGDGGTAGGPGPIAHTYTHAGHVHGDGDGERRRARRSPTRCEITVTRTVERRRRLAAAAVAAVAGRARGRAAAIRAPKAQNVRTVIRRGLRLRVSCEEACRARSVLRISGERVGASKRLRIGAGGSRTLVARLSRNVRRNLLAAMRQAGLQARHRRPPSRRSPRTRSRAPSRSR